MNITLEHIDNQVNLQIESGKRAPLPIDQWLIDQGFVYLDGARMYTQNDTIDHVGLVELMKSKPWEQDIPNSMLGGLDFIPIAKKKLKEEGQLSLFGISDKNKEWNKWIEDFKNKQASNRFFFGLPSKKLLESGIINKPIEILKSTLSSKINKHSLDINLLKDLPKKLNNPVAVFKSKTIEGGRVILTEIEDNNNKAIVFAVHFIKTKEGFELNNIASFHAKNNCIKKQYETWKDLLVWEDKKKTSKFIVFSSNCRQPDNLRGYDSKVNQKIEKSKPSPNKETTGLAGVNGLSSLQDMFDKKFNPLPLPKKWTDLFGQIELPTHFFLSGKGGYGKTGMALLFGEDVSKLKKNVLFASGEQYYSPTFKKLIEATGVGIDNPFFHIAPEYETGTYNPSMFDLVIIDSKDRFNLEPNDFEELTKKYPKTSFMTMSQSNKKGVFSGSGKWQNVVDVMLEVHERGKMRVGDKNRWGHYGEIQLFKTKQNKIK